MSPHIETREIVLTTYPRTLNVGTPEDPRQAVVLTYAGGDIVITPSEVSQEVLVTLLHLRAGAIIRLSIYSTVTGVEIVRRG